jgi:hypothetical protein
VFYILSTYERIRGNISPCSIQLERHQGEQSDRQHEQDQKVTDVGQRLSKISESSPDVPVRREVDDEQWPQCSREPDGVLAGRSHPDVRAYVDDCQLKTLPF